MKSTDHEIYYAACRFTDESAEEDVHRETAGNNGTFLVMEPRDESLLRKAKVREILKTFQEDQPEEHKQSLKKQSNQQTNDNKYQFGNFGEQFNRIEKPEAKAQKKSQSQAPSWFNNLEGELVNHTHHIGKPIIVQQQNRVSKKREAQVLRRRDMPQ